MMPPGLEPVKLTIQHVRDDGERLPVASAEMSEGPLHIIKSKTAGYSWIGINERTIVVIHELVTKGLAKRDPDDADKQNGDHGGQQPVTTSVRVATAC